MTRRTTSGSRTRKSGVLRRSFARFRKSFPRLLRTDFWTASRSRGLWTSIFGERKTKRSSTQQRPPRKAQGSFCGEEECVRIGRARRYRKPDDLRVETLERANC